MFASAYKFVSEPAQELKCLICLRVATGPLQHKSCGSLFCKECIEKHGKVKPCPGCKQAQPAFFLDHRRENAIQALSVKCTNMDEGSCCDWEGTVRTLDAHVALCKFPLTLCPNQCKDGEGKRKMLTKMTLAEHLKKDCPNREVKCEQCGKLGTYTIISGVHFHIRSGKTFQCPNTETVHCPNRDCTQKMQRQHITRHLETCEHALVPCKYKNIGCKCKLKQKDLTKHEEETDEAHLHLALDAIGTLQERDSELNLDKTQLTLEVAKLDYKFQAVLVNISRLEKRNHEKMQTLKKKLKDSILYTSMLDSEFEKVEELLSHVLSFKITDCLRREKDRVNFVSPAFYTKQGYHLIIQVLLDGGKGNRSNGGVVMSVSAMAGKFDEQLPWPFVGELTVTLLNQLDDSQHYDKTVEVTTEDGVGARTKPSMLCVFPFIPLEELYREDPATLHVKQYLVDDTLYFRVSVKERKPWLICSK